MNYFSKSLLTIVSRASLGILLSTLFCGQTRVEAQVSISPMIIEAEAERGRSRATINVGNQSSQTIRARVYAEPFTYTDRGFKTVEADARDLTPYLQFSPKELVIPPNTTRKIRLSTLFPPNMPEGEYRAAIFAERLQKSSASTNPEEGEASVVNTTLKIRLTSTIFVHQGELTPNLELKQASWNSEHKKIQVLVSNAGKASAYPSGNWVLKQGETEVATGSFPKTGIVAETERHFILNYPQKDKNIAPGEFQLTGELLLEDRNSSKKVPFAVDLTIPATSN